jgi:hypothetical protein
MKPMSSWSSGDLGKGSRERNEVLPLQLVHRLRRSENVDPKSPAGRARGSVGLAVVNLVMMKAVAMPIMFRTLLASMTMKMLRTRNAEIS